MTQAVDKGTVVRAMVMSAVMPGSGQFMLGQRLAPLVGLLAVAALVGVVAAHLTVGIGLFETSLGSLLLAHLMRSVPVIWGFLLVDTYLLAVDPTGASAPRRRRLAVVANLLLPGAGSALARAWIRMGTGLALVFVLAYFARAGHPYADVIFVGMQLIMAVAVYRQVRLEEDAERKRAELDDDAPAMPEPEPPEHLQEGQLVILIVLVLCAGVVVWVTEQRLPPWSRVTGLAARKTDDGLRLSVQGLGISLTAAGQGWKAAPKEAGTLFRVDHVGGAQLVLATQLMPAFTPTDRFVSRLRELLAQRGLSHKKTLSLTLADQPATQLRFSGRNPSGTPVDQWAVVVPRGRYAVLLLLSCVKEQCPEQAAMLEKTRDSLTFQ